MSSLAITAVGADRPGIIARITKVVTEHGGNLEDGTMTVLSGHFAIMLLVDVRTDPRELEEAVAGATADLGLSVTVRTVDGGDVPPPPTHLLSVYGGDRPGLLHEVTTVLADRDINVTDLSTRVIGGDRPVYAMALEVALDTLTSEELVEVITAAIPDVDASVHPLDTMVL